MSDFSEKLAHEIRNTNKPLRYLAEASGLQLDYISKMCRGKRIPQDEEKLKKLLDAMECVMRTRDILLQLYRQEKMGKIRWDCMKEMIRIIEQDASEYMMDRKGFPKGGMRKSAAVNQEEVFLFLQEIFSDNEKKRICIWTAAARQEAMERLMQMISGMACGIILKEKDQLEALKTEFWKKYRMARPLVNRSGISQYMNKVNQMMNTGYVTRNYYIEQSPCLLHLIPINLLKEHILMEGEEREELMRSIQLRILHMKQEDMVHIFSVEGLRYLMEEGRITGYPDTLYRPLEVPMRNWLLKRYYQYIQSTPNSCICVREDCIRLPRYMSIVSSSNVENGIAFWSSNRNGPQYYQIMESGISQKLYDFCRFLEEGNMALSCGETLEVIKKMIVEYGGTL